MEKKTRFRRLILHACLTAFLCTVASARARQFGYCEQGGQKVVTAGTNSTTLVQSSNPGCLVTVFLSDGVTLANLFSDDSGTPIGNPFQADSLSGYWFFYADNGRYNIQLSGGTIQGTILLGDVILADPAGGGFVPGGAAGGALTGTYPNPTLRYNATVRDFGATGNGSTDDTTSILNAIASVCASGNNRTLYFPTGTYVVSAELIIPCSMSIYGSGQVSTTIINKAGAVGDATFIVTAKNVSIRGLTIDGNMANLGTGYRMVQWSSAAAYAKYNAVFDAGTNASYVALQAVPIGTALTNVTYWLPVLTGLTPTETAALVKPGIGIEFRESSGSVTDVEITHEANWGVTINAGFVVGNQISHISVSNCYIHDIGVAAQGNNTDQAGVQNYNGTLDDLRVTDNRFENIYSPTYGPTASSAIFTTNASNVQLIGNKVLNCLNVNGGTVSADGTTPPYPSNILLKGNIITQTVYLNGDQTSCIEEDGANNVIIDGNICIGAAFDGAHMGGLVSGAQAGNFTVTNNFFSVKPTAHPGSYVVAVGFPSDSTTGGVITAVVSNNIIDGGNLAGYGFFIPMPSSDIYGRGNKVRNVSVGFSQDLSAIANILQDDANAWTGGAAGAISNTTSLTKMYGSFSGTIPNGMLQYNGATVDVKGGGIYSSIASPGTVNFTLFMGSSQVCSWGAPAIPASASNLTYTYSAQLIFFSNTVVCGHGIFSINGPSGATTNSVVSTTVTPISPNNAYTVDTGIQMSVANAGNSFTNKQMTWTVNYPGSKFLP